MKDSPDFTFVTFFQDHVVPVVRALAALVHEAVEAALLAVDLHALLGEELHLLGRERAHEAHGVLALDLVARVHQPVGEVARGGQDQQALGVEVEPAHRHPAAARDLRQPVEHGRPLAGIVLRDDLARRLVVDEHTQLRLVGKVHVYEAAPACDVHLVQAEVTAVEAR